PAAWVAKPAEKGTDTASALTMLAASGAWPASTGKRVSYANLDAYAASLIRGSTDGVHCTDLAKWAVRGGRAVLGASAHGINPTEAYPLSRHEAGTKITARTYTVVARTDILADPLAHRALADALAA